MRAQEEIADKPFAGRKVTTKRVNATVAIFTPGALPNVLGELPKFASILHYYRFMPNDLPRGHMLSTCLSGKHASAESQFLDYR